jgi:hypothetical protein
MGQSEECLGVAGTGADADIICITCRGSQSRLAKFQGHPGKRSPKARIHLMLGSVFPSKFKSVPPCLWFPLYYVSYEIAYS